MIRAEYSDSLPAVVRDARASLAGGQRRALSLGGRAVALGALGLALGAGGSLVAVSYVQAFDEAGIRQVQMEDYARSQRVRSAAPVQAAPAPARTTYHYAPAAYAPARTISFPFFRQADDGRLAAPQLNLNPFAPNGKAQRQARTKKRKKPAETVNAAFDTVSGAASAPRSICVRVCDGFHAPIGFLSSQSDVKAHEALCKAMNPGVPVKVYRVAAGASTIDEAVGPDGKTYGQLPMAYSHEKSADPACRPPIVQANERRVSILKDFTLRPGDAVVVNNSARIFNGASSYPYRASDFRDFRSSERLTNSDRRKVDQAIGHSFKLASERESRRAMRLREANLGGNGRSMIDIPMSLRGAVEGQNDSAYYIDGGRGRVRVIAPSTFGTGR